MSAIKSRMAKRQLRDRAGANQNPTDGPSTWTFCTEDKKYNLGDSVPVINIAYHSSPFKFGL